MSGLSDIVKISAYGRVFEAYGNGGDTVEVELDTPESNQLFELDAATEQRGVEMAVLNFFYNLFLKVALSKIRSLAQDSNVVDLEEGYFETAYTSVGITAKLILHAVIEEEIEEVDINQELAAKALVLFEEDDPILRKLLTAAFNDAQVHYLQGLVRHGWDSLYA